MKKFSISDPDDPSKTANLVGQKSVPPPENQKSKMLEALAK